MLVLEEHRCSGLPVQCAGLVTEDVIGMSGVRPDVLSTIFGAEVVLPDGSALNVRSGKPKALAVDRADLDSKMADAALAAGAEFSYGERYLSHTVGGSVEVATSAGSRFARLLVGADGHSSAVRASVPGNAPREYLRGIQADVSVRMDDQESFRVRLGNEVAPGFFSWEIPCGDFTRVGLCCSWSAGPPAVYLRRLLRTIGAEDRVMAMHSGKIPLGAVPRPVSDRMMLVGDAAAQVKPVSGGGLYPGLTAAGMLAETALPALAADTLDSRALAPYARGCDRVFGRELRNGMRLRRMLVRMSDDDLVAAGRYASRDDVRRVLDGIDIDRPSEVVRGLLAHPRAAIAAVPLLWRCLL